MEEIRFKADDNVELFGLLRKAKETTNKVLIAVHGMSNNCTKLRDQIMAKKVNEEGIDHFVFNNRGHDLISYYDVNINGKKERKLGGAVCEDPLDGYYDIVGAINEMRKRGYKEIYLQGHSLGCTKIVSTYNRLLKEERTDVLDAISAVLLLSFIDILTAQKFFLGDRFDEVLKKAEDAENEPLHFMKDNEFIHIVSAKTYLRYFRDYKDLYYPQYSSKMWKAEELNAIKVPIFMRWGNKNELILQEAEELANIVSSKLNNPVKDIGYIDGADHNYSCKESELAEEIANFIKKLHI